VASQRLTRLERALRRAGDELTAAGKGWALVGGLAVSARTEPRLTRDVDLAVEVKDDAEAELLVARLRAAGFEIAAILEQNVTGRMATVRLWPPGKDPQKPLVDLLFASSGIEPEIVRAAERLVIMGELTVPVATVGHLLAMKVLARDDRRRPQDHDDLRALLGVAGEADVAEARAALSLMGERGYGRGKDLLAEFEEIRVSSREP